MAAISICSNFHVDESWAAFSGQPATVTISDTDYQGVLTIQT